MLNVKQGSCEYQLLKSFGLTGHQLSGLIQGWIKARWRPALKSSVSQGWWYLDGF